MSVKLVVEIVILMMWSWLSFYCGVLWEKTNNQIDLLIDTALQPMPYPGHTNIQGYLWHPGTIDACKLCISYRRHNSEEEE